MLKDEQIKDSLWKQEKRKKFSKASLYFHDNLYQINWENMGLIP